MSVIDVEQTFYQVTKYEKQNTLKKLIEVNDDKRILVFVDKKRHADFLAVLLCEQQLPTSSIHGGRVRRDRERALQNFESGRHRILVATTVDLDIKNVDIVINYDLPKSIVEYVHRIGRTSCVGKGVGGKAVSFFDTDLNAGLVADLAELLLHGDQSIPDFLQGGSDVRNFNDASAAVSGVQESGEDW